MTPDPTPAGTWTAPLNRSKLTCWLVICTTGGVAICATCLTEVVTSVAPCTDGELVEVVAGRVGTAVGATCVIAAAVGAGAGAGLGAIEKHPLVRSPKTTTMMVKACQERRVTPRMINPPVGIPQSRRATKRVSRTCAEPVRVNGCR